MSRDSLLQGHQPDLDLLDVDFGDAHDQDLQLGDHQDGSHADRDLHAARNKELFHVSGAIFVMSCRRTMSSTSLRPASSTTLSVTTVTVTWTAPSTRTWSSTTVSTTAGALVMSGGRGLSVLSALRSRGARAWRIRRGGWRHHGAAARGLSHALVRAFERLWKLFDEVGACGGEKRLSGRPTANSRLESRAAARRGS